MLIIQPDIGIVDASSCLAMECLQFDPFRKRHPVRCEPNTESFYLGHEFKKLSQLICCKSHNPRSAPRLDFDEARRRQSP